MLLNRNFSRDMQIYRQLIFLKAFFYDVENVEIKYNKKFVKIVKHMK